MNYHNKSSYSGNWEKGRQEGQGTFIFPNGESYIGFWQSGKMHGKGTYTQMNGAKI